MASSRRHIIIAEDILPASLFRLPFFVKGREVWLTPGFRPVRGWIVQQILKLCAVDFTPADVLVFMDTDVFFIRSFEPRCVLTGDGNVRLLQKPGVGQSPSHQQWHQAAAKLLNIPPQPYFGADFIGNLITWRRDVAMALRERITETGKANWAKQLSRELSISEYIVYGIFVQELLGPERSGHSYTEEDLCLNSWDLIRRDQAAEQHDKFVAEVAGAVRPEHVAVNIQSNLGFPPSDYRKVISSIEHVVEN